MFDYLQKFNNLSKELREKVSTPAVMSIMGELEGKYGVDLAVTVMKVMVKDIDINNLDKYFSQEFRLDPNKSASLAEEMKNRVLAGAADYLGIFKVSSSGSEPSARLAGRGSSPSFFFDIEDEEEARGLAGDDLAEKKEIFGADLENRVNEIIVEANINFGSGELLSRFKKILATHVKGIRDRIETKQTLMKSFDAGGMGFDNISADQILKIAEIKKSSKTNQPPVEPPKRMPVPEDKRAADAAKLKSSGIRDVDYDFSVLAGRRKRTSAAQFSEGLDTDHELAPPTPSLSKVVLSSPASEKKPVEIKNDKISVEMPIAKEKIAPEVRNVLKELGIENSPSLTMSKRSPVETTKKPRLDDVKVVAKAMNPIDELRYMSLIGFRRLNRDPMVAAGKIKAKMKLLEEDEYGKRLGGIKAWRESPVYKSYLEIGHGSMSANRPISAIIEDIKSKNGDCLNNQEFEAVMNLNKDLRF